MKQVQVADVAPHPDNPRGSLGDLTGITDSIREFGVLEPVVVTPADAFLAAHPQHADAVGSRPYVLIAGHRRRAAAEAAGHDTLPAVIRADLAGEGLAAVAFVIENVHREDLAPLEEARAYSLLSDLGIGQREIARRTGVSQSHVSKRLVLLRLPQHVQDDLAAGRTTIADALALAQVPAESQVEVYALAQANRWPISSAAAEHARASQVERTLEAARTQAQHENVPVIDPTQVWGRDAATHALYGQSDIDAERERGNLVAAPTAHGLAYYSTEPVRGLATHAASSTNDDDAERRKANKARAKACEHLVATCPPTAQLAADTARTIMRGHVTFADSLKRVHKWLGATVGEADADPYAWHRSLIAADDPAITAWIGWALAVASDEGHATNPHTPWDRADVAHLRRLIDGTGYKPTRWEQQRLAALITPPATGDSAESPRDADTEEPS